MAIVSLACDSVDMRLAWLLVDLVRQGGGVVDAGARRLPVALSEATMALWIGASRRAVDRALAKWRARGGRDPPGREARHPRPGVPGQDRRDAR
jgi:hypothetical protein